MIDLESWIQNLIQENGLKSKAELTPTMLKSKIEEAEAAIRNEQIWRDGTEDISATLQHDQNITIQKRYSSLLRDLMKDNGNLSEHSLCISIYTDPDELPFQVVFLLPGETIKEELCTKLAEVRNSVCQEDDTDIEEQSEYLDKYGYF